MKVAGVQMDIAFADIDGNLQKMREHLTATTSAGARMTVFPECTTTGYCYRSLDEAKTVAEPVDGPAVMTVLDWCRELQTYVVFGFLESVEDQVYNSLALCGPDGVAGTYRKTHLPFLGVDRFTTPGGQDYQVVDTPLARIGLNICYDSSFPEATRILALRGADLVVLPTNWPPTSGLTADYVPNTRALENHVYFMAINRIGTERGFEFIGKSKICDPAGANLAFANHNREEVLFAEINVELARRKHLVNIPGEHEVHRFNDRRPDLYSSLSSDDRQ